MYIKDPKSNRMYAIDSENGRRLLDSNKPEVKPPVKPKKKRIAKPKA